MIIVPVTMTKDEDGNAVLSPSAPIPSDAIAVVCDGQHYTVYEPGDAVPSK